MREGIGRARSAVGIAAALALAAPGCLVESHEPSDPLPLERFCAAFADALCDPLAACACSDAAVFGCRSEVDALCRGFPSGALSAAVEDGRVRYDGARAAALVRRMEARAESCRGFVDALDWKVSDLLSLGGVFEGTLEPGEPCTSLGFELISECRGGSCAPVGGASVCVAAVGAGEACDRLHTCADLEGALTPERGVERLTLRCVHDPPDAPTGTCAAWVDDGGACETDGACWTSLCQDGRCASLADGAACFSGRECASGHCAEGGVCGTGDAEAGAPCADASACASHVCVAGLCEPAACGTF